MSEDLFIRRAYTHKGISVAVDIDLVKKTISLVDKNGGNKKWLFAERQLEYMAGWQAILDAMKYAVTEATKVLQEAEKRDADKFAEMLIALSNPTLKGGKS